MPKKPRGICIVPLGLAAVSEQVKKTEKKLGSGNKHKGLRTLHISHLLQMVLQDAQTRLFFKAQSVVQSEIRYYVPKSEDLAYPDKLVGMLRFLVLDNRL